jgi:hypothetical protein
LRRLVEMLAGGATDAHAYREAVARLVGLGPGLTPTGDDLLIALLAASMRLSAGDLMSDTVADKLNHEVGRIPPGRTTVVAHRLLSEAATGRFPQPLADLVRALGDRTVSRDELDGAVRWLAATGAHSGCDWLAGVVALAASVVESRGEE